MLMALSTCACGSTTTRHLLAPTNEAQQLVFDTGNGYGRAGGWWGQVQEASAAAGRTARQALGRDELLMKRKWG